MPREKTSKFSERLREIGCLPWSEIIDELETEESDALVSSFVEKSPLWQNRSERRRMVALKILPGFVKFPDHIFIIDECGISWRGEPSAFVGLLRLGFNDLLSDPRANWANDIETLH